MKAITFLGTTRYKETTYVFRDQECRTELFPQALYEFFKPAELLVFVTDDAKAMHFDTLCQRLTGWIMPQAVDIPLGRNDKELWVIFDRLVESVNAGDVVVFDITNAFRSIPLLIFIAIAYLRSAQEVRLEAITYGAFEARADDRTPVFDLSPFVGLLDWTTATDKFLKTGNALEIVELLREAHRAPYVKGIRESDLPRQLQGVAADIQTVSQAMRLVRAHEIMESAIRLTERLGRVQREVERWAKPFGVLLQQMQRAYAALALERPPEQVRENLATQLKLLLWYLDKGQTVQAIMLAREWVVSLTVYLLGWDLIDDRQTVEEILNTGAEAARSRRPLPTPLRRIENADEIVNAWNWLRDLRNDVAHAGMRVQPRPTAAIIQAADELRDRLMSLAPDLVTPQPGE